MKDSVVVGFGAAFGPIGLLLASCIIVPTDPLVSPSKQRAAALGGESPRNSATSAGTTPHFSGINRTDQSDPRRTVRLKDTTIPVIASLTANPTNLTSPDQEVVFHIEAVDASGAPNYSWSATGGTLTSTAGTRVGWRSPSLPGRFTVLVLVTSPSGGATTGAVNIEVRRDGSAEVLTQNHDVSPTPMLSPVPTPTPGSQGLSPTPSSTPSVCDLRIGRHE